MWTKPLAGVVLLLACLGSSTKVLAEPLVRMSGLRYEWVSQEMTSNGVPLQILGFSGERSVAQVLGFYRDHWLRDGKPPQLQHQGGWQVLSARLADEFVSLSIRRRAGQVEGYLLRSRPNSTTPSRASRVPLPPGVRVISRQGYTDAGRRGESLTLASFQQPATVAIGFERVLSEQGFRLTRAGRSTTTANGYTAEYSGAAGEIILFVHRDAEAYGDQSLGLLHFLERDG